MSDNIKVAIKMRPLIKREKENKLMGQWKIRNNTIAPIDNYSNADPFYFDHIFDENATNNEIFEVIAKPIVKNCLKGINGTIFAYGQTSSGKTFTMTGNNEEPGVMPLAVQQIFKEIDLITGRKFLIRVSYIEIYNEKINDLLDKEIRDLKICETAEGDVKVSCREVITNAPDQIMGFLRVGNKIRKMEETNMNERSSRSHTIFRIIIESREIGSAGDEIVQISNLNLVDLAGSERADQTGATGSRLKEGSFINKSLLSLSLVIQHLSENVMKYINYRDSKLTRILQASLGGNAMTSIICTITSAAVEETFSTLHFATSAKAIKNKPKVNEEVTEAAMMKRLQKEITRLQSQLEVEKRRNSNNTVKLLENQIIERETQFIVSNSNHFENKSRRKTWCLSSQTRDRNGEEKKILEERFLMPPPSSRIAGLPTNVCTRDDFIPTNLSESIIFEEFDNFIPEECLSNENSVFLSPVLSKWAKTIQTPEIFKKYTNKIDLKISNSEENWKEKYQQLDRELTELKDFTRLEYHIDMFEGKNKIKEPNMSYLEKEINSLKSKIVEKDIQLEVSKSDCSNLELKLSRMEEITNVSKDNLAEMDKIKNDFKQIQLELKNAIKEKDFAESQKISLEFEYEQYQIKCKKRERELIETLDEVRQSDDCKLLTEKLKQSQKNLDDLMNENTKLKFDVEEKIKQNEALIKEKNDTEIEYKKLETDLKETNEKFQNTADIISEIKKLPESMVLLQKSIVSLETEKQILSEKLKQIVNFIDSSLIDTKLITNKYLNYIRNICINNGGENGDLIQSENGETIQQKSDLINDVSELNFDDLAGDYSLNNTTLISNNSTTVQQQQQPPTIVVTDELGDLSLINNKNDNDLNEINNRLNEKINALEEQLINLNKQLSENEKTIIDLNKNLIISNDKLKLNDEHLMKIISEKDNEILRLKKEILINKKLIETNEMLLNEKNKLQQDYNETSTELLDAIEENDQIKQKLLAQQKEYDNEIISLKNKLNELNELISLRNNELESIVEEKHKLIKDFNNNMIALENLIEKYEIVKSDGERDFNYLLNQLDNHLNMENEKNMILIQKNDSELNVLNDKLSLLKNEKDSVDVTLTSTIDQLEKTIIDKHQIQIDCMISLKNIMDNYKIEYEMTDDNQDFNNILTQLELYLSNENEKMAALTQKYEIEINCLNEKMTSLNSEKDSMELTLKLTHNQLEITNKDDPVNSENDCSNNKALQELMKKYEIECKSSEVDDFNEIVKELDTYLSTGKEIVSLQTQKYENDLNNLNDKITTLNHEKGTIEVKMRSELNDLTDEKIKLEKIIHDNLILLNNLIVNFDNSFNFTNNSNSFDELIIVIENYLKENHSSKVEKNQLNLENLLKENLELNDSLIQYKETLENIETEHFNEITDLNNKIENVEEINNELKTINLDLEIEKSELKTNYDHLLIEKNNIYEQFETSKTDMDKVRNEFESKITNILHEKEESQKLFNEKISEKDQLIKKLEDDNQNLNSETVSMKKQFDDELKSFEKKFDMLICEKDQINERVKNLEEEREKLIFEKSLCDKTVKEIEEEREKLISAKDQFNEQLKSLNLEKTTLKSDLNDMKNQFNTELKKLEYETKRLINQNNVSIEENVIEIKCLNQKIKVLQEEKEKLISQINEVQKLIKELKEYHQIEIQTLEKGKITITNQLQEVTSELKSNELIYTNLKNELTSLKSDNLQLTEKLDEHQITLNSLERIITEKNTDNEELERQLTNSNDLCTKHKRKIIDLEKTINENKEEISKLTNSIDHLQVNYDNIESKQKTDLENKINDLEKVNYHLNQKLKENSDAQEQLFKISVDFSAMKTNYEQAIKKILKLETTQVKQEIKDKEIDELNKIKTENNEFVEQLHEMQKMHIFKVNQLQNDINAYELKTNKLQMYVKELEEKCNATNELQTKLKELKKERDETVQKQKTLLGENNELKVNNNKLFMELDELRNQSKSDRKSRRQSTHDENRSSLWDSRDIGIMTDKTDVACNCDVMNEKIIELKKAILLKDCQINTCNMVAKLNPYVFEMEELKKMLREEENEMKKTKQKYSELTSKCLEIKKENKNLLDLLQKIKEKYCINQEKFVELQKCCTLKENTLTDMMKTTKFLEKENMALKTDIEKITAEYLLYKNNYKIEQETLKGNEELKKLQSEFETMKLKYEKTKYLCQARKLKNDETQGFLNEANKQLNELRNKT